MEVFCKLFTFDFSELEKELGIDCFSVITNYTSIPKRAQNFNRNVSERVREVSDAISAALQDCGVENGAGGTEAPSDEAVSRAADRMLDIISDFYLRFGVGMFGLNRAFRLAENTDELTFIPINNTEQVRLSDLVGYEIQKQKLRDNTEALRRCGYRKIHQHQGADHRVL